MDVKPFPSFRHPPSIELDAEGLHQPGQVGGIEPRPPEPVFSRIDGPPRGTPEIGLPQIRAVEDDVTQTALTPACFAGVRSEEVASAEIGGLELYALQVHFSPIAEGCPAVYEGEVQYQRVQS